MNDAEKRIEAALALHQPYAHEYLGEVCKGCSDPEEWEYWMSGEPYHMKYFVKMPCPIVLILDEDGESEDPL